jgi:uncharacterized SAM-binding protein YcdF (DUF218 family)
MRTKIIAVNAIIVAIMGLLSFVVVRQSLSSALTNRSAQSARAMQDAVAASSKLQLQALQLERWLTAKAQDQATQGVVTSATAEARIEGAFCFACTRCSHRSQR